MSGKAGVRCRECDGMTRRDFLRTVGGAAVVAAGGSVALPAPARARTAAEPNGRPETLVKTFYESLTPAQKQAMAFPFDHPLRSKVENNWTITPVRIRSLTPDQQQMCREIFSGVHSEEYLPKILQQMRDDAGGIDNYTVAVFGTPGSGKFEWVLAGRHMTSRCDGDSVEGAAFGGPIFYGHQGKSFNEAPTHPGNVYWYQARRANELFAALDGSQRREALLGDPPAEQGNATVAIPARRRLAGIPVAELSRDQKGLVEKVMADLLAPFRKADADEAMKCIEMNGGLASLSMAFYKNMDIGSDGVWDVWSLEGPAMVWYFRGAPHVHTWVNIATKPQQ